MVLHWIGHDQLEVHSCYDPIPSPRVGKGDIRYSLVTILLITSNGIAYEYTVYSWKIWQSILQLPIFLLAHTRQVCTAIWYRTTKFKSANILAIATLGSTAKFNSCRLYGIINFMALTPFNHSYYEIQSSINPGWLTKQGEITKHTSSMHSLIQLYRTHGTPSANPIRYL